MATRLEINAEPLPGYRLLERLGGGGFGEVWKCEAPGGLHKAIKFVYGSLDSGHSNTGQDTGMMPVVEGEENFGLGDNDEEGRQARQEYKALERVKRVRHPYILNLERYDIIDGQLIIVMELADRNLWDRFKECRSQGLAGIPREELLGYLEEAAEALDLMNGEYQLQHLDIKPQNLFLVHNHIKVADFGLVKFLEGMETKVTGGITPVYAAPETFDGVVSRHCDQYSLAIVYQELLTGQRPFPGTNIRQLILQHIQGQPDVSALSPGERAIILRSLAKNPNERFPTCREVLRLLRQSTRSAGNPLSVTPTPGQRPRQDSQPTTPNSDPGVHTPAATALLRRPSDSALGMTQSLRVGELSVLRAAAESTARAPAEIKGDGILFPGLVIGLGQLGLGVLQGLRQRLVEDFGGMDALPNLKLLLLDTDPEVMRAASQGKRGAVLATNEVLLMPLNRPSHYLRPRAEGGSRFEEWINQRMLYRIPRSQVTAGVRALGRLAFCDNYRVLLRRLQLDLDSILEPKVLREAATQTKLGMRSNRPRIYLVASLGGGTGSGMFLDLAYSVRALLKQYGYEQADIVAILLVPKTDGTQAPMMLGNAFAALTELRYYATPGTVFQASYHERETPISDPEPPFTRTLVLQLPEEADEAGTRELQDMAGQMLFRDLCSSLGRTADLARAGLTGPAWPERGLYCQTFGLSRLSWPRRELIREAGRQLCLQLLARWMSKDSKALTEPVTIYVRERWREQQLAPDSFIEQLQEGLHQALNKDPETALLAVVEPLVRKWRAQATNIAPKRWTQTVVPVEPAELANVLEEIERLVGRPAEETVQVTLGQLGDLLRESGEELADQWSQKLAEITVQLLEEPEYRLAGAEEAVRQVVALLDQVLQQYEPLLTDVWTRLTAGQDLLHKLLARQVKEVQLNCSQLIELLRTYPKLCLQHLILQQVSQSFLALRGHMSDQLREINFCRVRLGEIQRHFETVDQPVGSGTGRRSHHRTARPGTSPSTSPGTEAGRVLFPGGSRTLAEAVEQVLRAVDEPGLLELDYLMEGMIQHHFQALVNVCMTNANIMPAVERAMLETAEDYVGGFLANLDVAEMFLEQTSDPAEQLAELAEYFEEAEPGLNSAPFALGDGRRSYHGEVPLRELRILAHPAGAAGEELLRLVQEAQAPADVDGTLSTEDVLFYREVVNVHLAHLEQLGEASLDAYRRMNATENFTPHTRTDVDYSPVVSQSE
jgi:serine/threonine protein kinase